MTMFLRLLLILTLTVVSGGTPLSAQNAIPVEFKRVLKPPKDFLAHGDVAGLSPAAAMRLGIAIGAPIRVSAPNGRTMGMYTASNGTTSEGIYLKKSLRDILGITEGEVPVKAEPVKWPTGPLMPAKLEFREVQRPPERFLEAGEAVGVGLDVFMRLNAAPGIPAVLTGPTGSIDVLLELIDRGPGVIAMKQTLRAKIGVAEGMAMVTLEVTGVAPKGILWGAMDTAAVERARFTGKPILAVARQLGDGAPPRAPVFDEPEVQALLAMCICTEYDPAVQVSMAQRLGVTTPQAAVLVSYRGEALFRTQGTPTKEELIAGLSAALKAFAAKS